MEESVDRMVTKTADQLGLLNEKSLHELRDIIKSGLREFGRELFKEIEKEYDLVPKNGNK